jgi:hypothetical protein
MAPEAGPGCYQPHSVEWLSSRCGAGVSVDWRARVRIKVSGHLCIKCPCDLVGWRGDLTKVASW